jgi:hypothetical protein
MGGWRRWCSNGMAVEDSAAGDEAGKMPILVDGATHDAAGRRPGAADRYSALSSRTASAGASGKASWPLARARLAASPSGRSRSALNCAW